MAGDAAKKLLKQNSATMSKYRLIILAVNAVYALYRIYYLWETFSSYHVAAFALTTFVYGALYLFLSSSATPKYKPGGELLSVGVDLNQKGVIEYTWDMLYTTMFVQLSTAFISDWFWLLYLIPPAIGLYYLWTMVIYPWISRPDANADADPGNMKGGKAGRVKYAKGR